MTSQLDHLVLACSDLAATVDWFTEASGVQPAPGGSHVGRGTANALVGLTGARGGYLEIVGPDPDQPDPDQPRPLRVDEVDAPTLVTWAVRPDDIDVALRVAREHGYDPGDPDAMSRLGADGSLLSWRLTPGTFDTSGGVVPFLIDWGDTPHPTARDLPTVDLVELRATHPDPTTIAASLSAIDVDLPITAGAVCLSARLRTLRGEVRL